MLNDVDLGGRENRPPTKLSGGERQRVAIARALANDPDLLLADEPTGNLDERSVDRVLDLFSRVRAQRPSLTTVIVTHDGRVADTADASFAFGTVTWIYGPAPPPIRSCGIAGCASAEHRFADRMIPLASMHTLGVPRMERGLV